MEGRGVRERNQESTPEQFLTKWREGKLNCSWLKYIIKVWVSLALLPTRSMDLGENNYRMQKMSKVADSERTRDWVSWQVNTTQGKCWLPFKNHRIKSAQFRQVSMWAFGGKLGRISYGGSQQGLLNPVETSCSQPAFPSQSLWRWDQGSASIFNAEPGDKS